MNRNNYTNEDYVYEHLIFEIIISKGKKFKKIRFLMN